MIDEKKLIESVKAYKELGLGRNLHLIADTIIEIIEGQPKVGEWIPVEERLPEEVGSYLVTVQHTGGYKYLGISAYFGNGMWAWENDKANVIAWQPLLEPFKGETE